MHLIFQQCYLLRELAPLLTNQPVAGFHRARPSTTLDKASIQFTFYYTPVPLKVKLKHYGGGWVRIDRPPLSLARRGDDWFHGIVNCAPARGHVWPVVAPAAVFVRAGERRGNSECGIRNSELERAGWVFGTALRFYHNVVRAIMPVDAVLLKCLASDHACLFFLVRKKRDGLRYAAFLFPRGSKSPLVRSRVSYGYRTLWVHFGIVRFLLAIPTELRRERGERETQDRNRRRGGSTLLCNHIGLAMFSAGSTLGLRAPDCAKESSTLWTLFMGFAAKYLFAQSH